MIDFEFQNINFATGNNQLFQSGADPIQKGLITPLPKYINTFCIFFKLLQLIQALVF